MMSWHLPGFSGTSDAAREPSPGPRLAAAQVNGRHQIPVIRQTKTLKNG